MVLRLGSFISAFFLLVLNLPSFHNKCTTLRDLSQICGCQLTKENFNPVCGNDGQSYLNMCFLHCQETVGKTRINVRHNGACEKDSQCACNSDYNPVCGNNGITYSNRCVLNCYKERERNVEMKHWGKCAEKSKSWSDRKFSELQDLTLRKRQLINKIHRKILFKDIILTALALN